jgi:hypothetical protein
VNPTPAPTTPGGKPIPSDADVIKSIKALPTTGSESGSGTPATQILVVLLMAAITAGVLAVMLRTRQRRDEQLERARVRVRRDRR